MCKLILATLAIVALGSAALAQSRTYQPIQPLPKLQEGLAGAPPRSDFPGAKQAANPSGKVKQSTLKSTSKRHAQRSNHGKHHAS
jgi:hypothetical protein